MREKTVTRHLSLVTLFGPALAANSQAKVETSMPVASR